MQHSQSVGLIHHLVYIMLELENPELELNGSASLVCGSTSHRITVVYGRSPYRSRTVTVEP
jgi:hypothetical protein